MGAEARSYALATAGAVVLTVVLLYARRRGGAWPFVVYGVLAAASVFLFAYLLLVIAAHLLTLVLLRPGRGTLVSFGIAALGAVVVTAPFLRIVAGQKSQIAWLGSQATFNGWTVLVEPWFESSVASAIVCWLLLIVAALRWRAVRAAVASPWLVVAGGWILVPTVLLVMANLAFGPLYTSRYLSFTAPGMALLLAASLAAFPWRRALAVGVAVLVIVAAPNYVAQRGPVAKNGGSDLRQIAQTVRAHARAGDAIVFQNASTPALHPRQSLYGYPRLYAGLRDVSLVTAFPATGTFFDRTVDVAGLGPRLTGVTTLWFVTATLERDCSSARQAADLASFGFAAVHTYPVNRTTVCEFVRG
jgi:mannosyltransferase